jgi:hypothetical protein
MNRYFIILLFLICAVDLSMAQTGDSLVNNLKLSGYYENAFQVLDKKDDILLDYNKLRLNMDAKIDENFSFNSDVIFTTYHGTTTINFLDYIPGKVTDAYLASIGQSKDMVGELFKYTYEDQIFLDNAYVSYYSDHFNFRIGKQQLPWGSGYIWNPTNIFHVKNPLDPTYELTGVNAIKTEFLFGKEGMLTGIYSVNDNFKNSTYAVKVKDYFVGFDISASYVYYTYTDQDLFTFSEKKENRQIVGFDLAGSVLGAGIWAELAYNFKTGKKGGGDYGRYVAGLDYTLNNGLYFMAEYYYNEKGKDNCNDYDMNDWMQSFGQYAENLGRHNLFIGQGFPVIANNLNWTNFVLLNLSDKSGMVYPWFTLSVGDNSEISGTAYIPFGKKESEFGGYGFGGLVRIRIYF